MGRPSLNPVRNAVMHPAKGVSLDDENFAQVRNFQKELTVKTTAPTWDKILAQATVTGPIE